MHLVRGMEKLFSGLGPETPFKFINYVRYITQDWRWKKLLICIKSANLKQLFYKKSIWNFVNQSIFDIMTFIDKTISEHQSDTNTDLISAYLSKIQDSPDPDTTFHGQLGMQNLKTHLLDLLFAGTETTSTAIMWALLCLMKWPEKQVKMFKEIEEVVGRGKLVEQREILRL